MLMPTKHGTPCSGVWRAFTLGALSGLAAIGLAGCAGGNYAADDALASRIDEALLVTDELNLSRIEVSVEPGVIYLSGMSDDHESKVHAEQVAQDFAEDRIILNKIEVDF